MTNSQRSILRGTIFHGISGMWAASIVARDPVSGKRERLTFSGKSRSEVEEKLIRALARLRG
ncbi:MAG: hypothetical protein HPY90_10070 [Syntrophothermus sp.]|uniref:hypothetical protein n=1 Tax=Syntrophothermus sp. TaxID=2736299 RepID=UPI002579F75C|nr:hypothetical protein [Syntrophothermus sp.]NSW83597.1 hypothetical protein [Syntrophothermus sp.]